MNILDEKALEFNYYFILNNGVKREFKIKLNPENLSLVSEKKKEIPEWAKLDYNKCSNCPFNSKKQKNCPVAVAIIDILDFFNDSVSFENVEVRLDTPERSYLKRTNLQSGVSSILGIYMVTSGCPILNKLRPMVRFHLPFATVEETIYRSMSMYLVKQFLRKKRGLSADWELKGLTDIYDEIHLVNRAFHKRLLHLKGQDANLNALVILDNFANYINFVLDLDKLTTIERLFEDMD